MADTGRPRIPDPSATIPDFGPRPDVKVLEKRAEVIRMLEGDASVAPAPPPRRMNALLLAAVALIVAVIAGSASFFLIVFAGLAIYALMGI